jgi:F-type H+-transporting ATPase subunit beta
MKGKIKTIIGPVVDVEFADGHIPAIYNALEIALEGGKKLVLETAYHTGGNSVRAIAMDTTDGISRGMEVCDTGAPISVPVGKQTLGRIFNVLGDTIDGKEQADRSVTLPIHRHAPEFTEQATKVERQVSRSLTSSVQS